MVPIMCIPRKPEPFCRLLFDPKWNTNSNRCWYKALKMHCSVSAAAFIPYRRVCKSHFCLYPSILLEITKIQNKYMNDMMKKTYEDLERWDGLFKISKMYLKLYWFVAFPSLCCLLICHSFHRWKCPTSFQRAYSSPCLCSCELGHNCGMMMSTSAITVSHKTQRCQTSWAPCWCP